MSKLAKLLVLALTVGALASCSVEPIVLKKKEGLLQMQVEWVGGEPSDPYPRVLVDDQPVGHLKGEVGTFHLSQGSHVIEVRSPGFVEWRSRVFILGKPDRQFLRVKLHRRVEIPEEPAPAGGQTQPPEPSAA